MIQFLFPVYLSCIFGIPFVASLLPVLSVDQTFWKAILLFTFPVVFSVCFVVIAGLLSKPAQRAIVAGKFPRDLKNPLYALRRLYGLCWTSVFYFTPLYYVMLSVPVLKKTLFRTFGYKGSLNFTVYADTWIRDLPLLHLEEGAYLANKATMGTNMCLGDGSILIDSIHVGKNGLIGHLAMIAPGSQIHEKAEIGVGTAFGIRAVAKENCKISPTVSINHGAVLGKDCDIGFMSYVGVKAVIKDGIRLPPASNIPSGAVINTQEDVDNHMSSENASLLELREKMKGNLKKSYASNIPKAS